MITSNLQDKKLKIIEQLIIINDEKLFDKVEDIINFSLKRPNLKRFSKSELIQRAKQSNLDIDKNDIISQKQVEKLILKW